MYDEIGNGDVICALVASGNVDIIAGLFKTGNLQTSYGYLPAFVLKGNHRFSFVVIRRITDRSKTDYLNALVRRDY
ncbi:Uncharacterised protein [Mycobacteroides abscessus subsp. massiliense]|nr:Uncharacterised protein [Mycobacteroides abscessus subsp. massiliense]